MKDVTQTYIDNEEAVQREPVELYHFWRDGGEHWRYTDGDVAVDFDGNTYSPTTLNRSSTRYDIQLEITTLTITSSYINDPVLKFIAINPIEILWVSISKLHRDQSPLETDVIFMGQIKNVSFKGTAAEVACVGFEHFLKKVIPRWRYQLTCNHILFDEYCSLTKVDYKIEAVVTLDETETILSSATFALQDDGYFIGGEIVFGLEARTIVAHSGTDITLIYRMENLDNNDTVEAYPGCDRRIETCRDTFDNIINFLGFPFLPRENPAMRTP